MRIKSKIAVLFCAAFMFVACDRKMQFEAYYEIGSKGWHKDSLAVFNVEIPSSTESYNLFFNVRNVGNYPYSNLWLFVDIATSDTIAIRDTVELALAKPNGKWLGSGLGDLHDLQIAYKKYVHFPQKGTYRIVLQQGMRNDYLKGIHDIGIRVEKAK